RTCPCLPRFVASCFVRVCRVGESPGQGTEWNEQRRIERLAYRPLLPYEVRPVPSQLTGEKKSAWEPSRKRSHCSAIELRPEGRRDSNPQPVSCSDEGTPTYAAGRHRGFQGA